ITDFSQAISRRQNYNDAYYQRGLAYLDNGEYYNSLADAKFLTELENSSSRAHFLEGLAHEALKKHEEAISAFSYASGFDPEIPGLYVNRATIYFYMGELPKAMEDLVRAEDINPREANIYNLRSMIAFEQENFEQALAYVEKAIYLDSSHPFFYNNRG